MSTDQSAIKRFYKRVSIAHNEGRFSIQLDDRSARTAMRNTLSAPTQVLAKAIADEWEAQHERVVLASMPLTRLLSAAVDGRETSADEWRSAVVEYLKSDLVCYRAEGPDSLVTRQAKTWDPYIDWLQKEFGAALIVTNGVVFTAQPDDAINAIENALRNKSAETLLALKTATSITGSAVMALALWKRGFEPEDIFEASRVDECFQEEKWGVDEEAKAREKQLRSEFLDVSCFLSLL